jgi:hypothetical protein
MTKCSPDLHPRARGDGMQSSVSVSRLVDVRRHEPRLSNERHPAIRDALYGLVFSVPASRNLRRRVGDMRREPLVQSRRQRGLLVRDPLPKQTSLQRHLLWQITDCADVLAGNGGNANFTLDEFDFE